MNPNIHQEIIYEKVGMLTKPVQVKKLAQTSRPKSVDMSAARTRVASARESSSTTTGSAMHRGRREGNLSMVNIETPPLAEKTK